MATDNQRKPNQRTLIPRTTPKRQSHKPPLPPAAPAPAVCPSVFLASHLRATVALHARCRPHLASACRATAGERRTRHEVSRPRRSTPRRI